MLNSNTDKEWEKFGKENPYYGVLTQDKYDASNLTEKNREEFFRSGEEYIDGVLKKIKRHIDPSFTFKRALDFGCGVGRLVIPLAKVAQEVVGIDISDSMLQEAKKNCEERSLRNVVFARSDDSLSLAKGAYDLIHSYIVLQHIPVKRGERIFASLMDRLEGGGVGVVHFTYARRESMPFVRNVVRRIPYAINLVNVIKGKGFFAPQMQMNNYDLNRLFLFLQTAAVTHCYTEFTDHGGALGVVVYFQKPRKA